MSYTNLDRAIMGVIERNALAFFLGMAATVVLFIGIAR